MAGTTSDKLSAVLLSKERIRSAIEQKGVECGADVPLSQYDDKILSINTGGSGAVSHGTVGVGGVKILGTLFTLAGVGQYVKETVE